MRVRLQVQLGRSIALVAVVVQGLVVLALSLLTSRQIHERTDILLLHLAHSEAHAMQEHGAQFHVHDLEFQLPGSFGRLSDRYALVFDQTGAILDCSDNLATLKRVDERLPMPAQGSTAVFLDGSLADVAVRLVILPAIHEGRPVFIAVGVMHADLEAVLWDFVWIALAVGLLAAAAISLAGWALVRRRVADLNRLSEACRDLMPGPDRSPREHSVAQLETPVDAVVEVQLLAETLQDLMARVQNQLDAQNRFVAEAAHELRTPLTSLRGDLELALRRERSTAEYRELIGEALADVDRLQHLAQQLLEGASGQHQHFPLAGVDLGALLQQLLAEYPEVRTAVALELPDPFEVAAEETAARRVLQILLDNWARHAEGAPLRINQVTEASVMTLIFADEGPGISADLRDRLFQPFQRGSQKGFGLGLYIAAQLMAAMEGRIEHQPSTHGCKFALRFQPVTVGRP